MQLSSDKHSASGRDIDPLNLLKHGSIIRLESQFVILHKELSVGRRTCPKLVESI